MLVTVNLPPKPTILDQYRHDTNLTQARAIAELIDNSLDAGARKVEIDYDRAAGQLSVTDNGSGCSNITRMLQIGGDKTKGQHKKLGRYGVGFNAAVLRFGDECYIHSCNALDVQSIHVDWRKIESEETWDFTFSQELALSGAATGVTVQVADLQIDRFQLTDIIEESAQRFRPALIAGTRIIVCGQRLKPMRMPSESQLSDQIVDSLMINGRIANIRAGRLIKPFSDWAGFWVRYKHRYILMANAHLIRAGAHSMRFFCDVELQDGTNNWELDTTKNNLSERDFEMLKEALTKRLSVLYDLLKEESQKVICEDLNALLAEAFNETDDEVGDAERKPKDTEKPPRPPRPEPGDRIGGEHKKAKKIKLREGGKYHRKKRQPVFEIKIEDFGNSRIGFKCTRTDEDAYIISLNREHPLITDREDDLAEMAMLASSTILLKQHELNEEDRLIPDVDPKTINAKLSSIWAAVARNFPIAKHKVA